MNRNSTFWVFVILLTSLFSCKQEKNQVNSAISKDTAPVVVANEEVKVPKEDYSKAMMAVARKEYEPLGRKILENKKAIEALSQQSGATPETNSKMAQVSKRFLDQQASLEALFVENMKMMEYIDEKEASKEMTKEQIKIERQNIQASLKKLESNYAELVKSIKKTTPDSTNTLH